MSTAPTSSPSPSIDVHIYQPPATTLSSSAPSNPNKPTPDLEHLLSEDPLLWDFTEIHASCIEEDGTIANYMRPLNKDKIHDFWVEKAEEASRSWDLAATTETKTTRTTTRNSEGRGERVIIYTFIFTNTNTTTDDDKDRNDSLSTTTLGSSQATSLNNDDTVQLPQQRTRDRKATAVVMLFLPGYETMNMRGEVQKLLVSPRHRGQGLSRVLMTKLEDVAREKGRNLIVSFLRTLSFLGGLVFVCLLAFMFRRDLWTCVCVVSCSLR